MTWLYVPSISAPATEASSSPCDAPESTPEPWLTLNGIPTQRPLSWLGWRRRIWIRHLSGLTSPRSTLSRGVAEWISSLPGSRANRSVRPANVEVSMMSDGSGRTLPGSWLTWDRGSSSWRTSPSLFDTGFHTSSPTLPSSGSMRSGRCSPRPPLVPLISAIVFGSWPTPTGMDAKSSGMDPKQTHGITLTDRAVRMWATPVAKDDQKSPAAHLAMKARLPGGPRTEPTSLTVQGKMWVTPSASDGGGGSHLNRGGTRRDELLLPGQMKAWPTPAASAGARGSDPIRTNPKAGGLTLNQTAMTWPTPTSHDSKGEGFDNTNLWNAASLHDPTTSPDGSTGSPRADLNPRFVAALMGVPPDWLTPSISVGTDSFRSWLRVHCLRSPIA